jgi:hypothetical protein
VQFSARGIEGVAGVWFEEGGVEVEKWRRRDRELD